MTESSRAVRCMLNPLSHNAKGPEEWSPATFWEGSGAATSRFYKNKQVRVAKIPNMTSILKSLHKDAQLDFNNKILIWRCPTGLHRTTLICRQSAKSPVPRPTNVFLPKWKPVKTQIDFLSWQILNDEVFRGNGFSFFFSVGSLDREALINQN